MISGRLQYSLAMSSRGEEPPRTRPGGAKAFSIYTDTDMEEDGSGDGTAVDDGSDPAEDAENIIENGKKQRRRKKWNGGRKTPQKRGNKFS